MARGGVMGQKALGHERRGARKSRHLPPSTLPTRRWCPARLTFEELVVYAVSKGSGLYDSYQLHCACGHTRACCPDRHNSTEPTERSNGESPSCLILVSSTRRIVGLSRDVEASIQIGTTTAALHRLSRCPLISRDVRQVIGFLSSQ